MVSIVNEYIFTHNKKLSLCGIKKNIFTDSFDNEIRTNLRIDYNWFLYFILAEQFRNVFENTHLNVPPILAFAVFKEIV
jgi:hypothetical protein